MEKSNKRIEWIDYAKSLAIIFVIIGHAISEYSLNIKVLEIAIYSMHMPLFFILSGLVFKIKENQKTSTYIIEKFKKIFLPYLLFCILILLCHVAEYFILHKSSTFFKSLFTINGVINTCLMTSKSVFSNLWFLPCLFLAQSIMYLIIKYIKSNYAKAIIALVPGIFILIFKINYPLPMCFFTSWVALVYLYIGFLLKKYIKKNNYILISSLIIFVIATIYEILSLKLNLNLSFYNIEIDYPYLFFITSISGSFLVIQTCLELSKINILEVIGRNTLYIYGFHFIAQNLIAITLGKISCLNKNDLIFLILSTIVNLAICMIGIRIVKILNNIFKGEMKNVRKKA